MSWFRKEPSIWYVLLIGVAVVMFWRGAWGLMDLMIFPNNDFISYVVSLLLGVGILVVTHKLNDELG